MMEYVRKDLICVYLQCGRDKALSANVIYELIEQIPVADVRENVHGEWIPHHTIKNCYICSACTHEVISRNVDHEYAFCPKCGAIMDEGDK